MEADVSDGQIAGFCRGGCVPLLPGGNRRFLHIQVEFEVALFSAEPGNGDLEADLAGEVEHRQFAVKFSRDRFGVQVEGQIAGHPFRIGGV